MESLTNVFGKMGHDVNGGNAPPETPEERAKWHRDYIAQKCEFFNEAAGHLHERDGYNCDICKNKGGISVLKEENGSYYEAYRPCKCMKIRSMLAKLERSGLKDVIKEKTFEKFVAAEPWQEKFKETAIQFTKDDAHNWFFAGGQSGSGKTHICTAIAVHYLRQNKDVHYMLWRDEIDRIKGLVGDSEQYGKEMEKLKTVEVLYIDDLFKMGKDQNGNVQPPTVADINKAFEILNYRYNKKGLVTIISSERRLQDILEIDTATGGRISEMTVPYGYYIGFKADEGKNYRTKGIVEF